MNTTIQILIGTVVVGLAIIGLVFSGLYDLWMHSVLKFWHIRHSKFRRHTRPSRIFIVRHGQSQANIDTTLYSRLPDHKIELTELGHQQATEAGEKLQKIIGKQSVYVYFSPYKRGKQTWANIRKAFSPVQIVNEREEPRLREQEFGNLANLETQPKVFEERDKLGHFFYRFATGESGADVFDRASLFLETLFREIDNGHHDASQNIIIVSHELFMRLFLMRFFHWTVDELDDLKTFDNCEICEIRKVHGLYTLDGRRRPPAKEVTTK